MNEGTLDALTICGSASMAGPDRKSKRVRSLYRLKGLRRRRIVVPISTRDLNSPSISGVPSSRECANRQEGGIGFADSAWGESENEEEDGLSSSK